MTAEAPRVTVPPPTPSRATSSSSASGRSSAGGRRFTRTSPPLTDTRACARDHPGQRMAGGCARVVSAGHREGGRLGRVSGQHARVAHCQQLRGRKPRSQHERQRRRAARPPPARARGASREGRGSSATPQRRAAATSTGLCQTRRRIGTRTFTRTPPAARRSTDSPRSSGLRQRASRRPLRAQRRPRQPAPPRGPRPRTATACDRSARAARRRRQPAARRRHDRHRFDRCLTGFAGRGAPRATVPRAAAHATMRGGYGRATRSCGSASRPSRGRRTPAPAARTRQAHRRRPRRTGAPSP